jgi:hypothetical protein
MSLLMTCLFAPLIVTSPAGQQAPAINALIKQMGSERYRERDAATKALQKTGVRALAALRKAANDNADAEIRLRARQLVQRIARCEIGEIKKNKLSTSEKCRRLSKVIEQGMACEQVLEIFGDPAKSTIEGSGMSAPYPDCGVVIYYRWKGGEKGEWKVSTIDKYAAK